MYIKYWKEIHKIVIGTPPLGNKHTNNFLYSFKNFLIFYNYHELLVQSEEC